MAKKKKCESCIAEMVCKAYEDDSRCVSFFAEFAEALKPSHNSQSDAIAQLRRYVNYSKKGLLPSKSLVEKTKRLLVQQHT